MRHDPLGRGQSWSSTTSSLFFSFADLLYHFAFVPSSNRFYIFFMCHIHLGHGRSWPSTTSRYFSLRNFCRFTLSLCPCSITSTFSLRAIYLQDVGYRGSPRLSVFAALRDFPIYHPTFSFFGHLFIDFFFGICAIMEVVESHDRRRRKFLFGKLFRELLLNWHYFFILFFVFLVKWTSLMGDFHSIDTWAVTLARNGEFLQPLFGDTTSTVIMLNKCGRLEHLKYLEQLSKLKSVCVSHCAPSSTSFFFSFLFLFLVRPSNEINCRWFISSFCF